MKTFEVVHRATQEGGEYVLGSADTKTHACYMIYGTLKPGEGGRVIRPGTGHEELVLCVRGELEVTGAMTGVLREGSAFHIAEDNECHLKNRSESEEAVYIAAGGHSGKSH